MSSWRRARRAFRLFEACLLVVALSWHQMIATPLMACMLADDTESVMDCPVHGDMHAHATHADLAMPSSEAETATGETGATIRCADECESQALQVMSTSAPVPARVLTVLAPAGVHAPIHDDSHPDGLSVAPGVPPPRS
jgi:hypothetical protein